MKVDVHIYFFADAPDAPFDVIKSSLCVMPEVPGFDHPKWADHVEKHRKAFEEIAGGPVRLATEEEIQQYEEDGRSEIELSADGTTTTRVLRGEIYPPRRR